MANVAVTFGGYYWSSASSTTLSAATPAKAAGTTTAFSGGNGFTHVASNRIRYDGTTTRVFHVTASFSAATTTGADTAKFHIYENGSLVTGATVTREVANNDIGAVCVQAQVSLATNDYVEVWLETTGGDDLTVQDGQVLVRLAG